MITEADRACRHAVCFGSCVQCHFTNSNHLRLIFLRYSDTPITIQKKPKMEDDEYVCTDCGTTESPEWRKGPMGPKT